MVFQNKQDHFTSIFILIYILLLIFMFVQFNMNPLGYLITLPFLISLLFTNILKISFTIHEHHLEIDKTFLEMRLGKKKCIHAKQIKEVHFQNKDAIKIKIKASNSITFVKPFQLTEDIHPIDALQLFCLNNGLSTIETKAFKIADKGRKLKQQSLAFEKQQNRL